MRNYERMAKYADVYTELTESGGHSQDNDCSIATLAILCRTTYKKAADALRKAGKKDDLGAPVRIIREAIKLLGYDAHLLSVRHYIDQYPPYARGLKNVTAYHPDRFPKAFMDPSDGNQMWVTCNHVFAFCDGWVEDDRWDSHAHVYQIYDVFPKGKQPKPDDAYKSTFKAAKPSKTIKLPPVKYPTFACDDDRNAFVNEWNRRADDKHQIDTSKADIVLKHNHGRLFIKDKSETTMKVYMDYLHVDIQRMKAEGIYNPFAVTCFTQKIKVK